MDKEQREKRYENKPPMNLIEASKHKEEWIMDELGFFLIDPRPEEGLIYAHHYKPDKSYHVTIKGKSAEEVYYTLLREKLIGSLMHAAYLGSELQKAEILVRYNINMYTQDRPLILPLDIEARLKKDKKACKDEKN